MPFSTLIIVVLSVIVIAMILAFRYALNRGIVSNEKKMHQQILNLKEENYVKDSEIKRLTYIGENNKFNEKNTLNPTIEMLGHEAQLQDRNEIMMQKNELEREKEQIQQRNKALWDQSIAIHKEKERIDVLRREIERKHIDVTDSIRYAERIQRALMSGEEILSKYFRDYFIFFSPRNIVSGDFYWAYANKSTLILVAADSTGHGVPGAFMSVLGISMLNEIALHGDLLQPADMLEQMRAKIKLTLGQTGKQGEQRDGMDMALCVLDLNTNMLRYSGAYNPFWLFRENPEDSEKPLFVELKADSQPVGIHFAEVPFTNQELQLLAGDTFYIFSDGYYSQFGGPKNRKIKKVGLSELISSVYKLPMEVQKQRFIDFLEDWKGDYGQTDDVIVIGVRVNA